MPTLGVCCGFRTAAYVVEETMSIDLLADEMIFIGPSCSATAPKNKNRPVESRNEVSGLTKLRIYRLVANTKICKHKRCRMLNYNITPV